VEEIVETPVDELNQIEGFEEEISLELQNRAKTFLDKKAAELKEKQSALGLKDDLMSFKGLSASKIIKLGENRIKTLDDLADLAADELVELLGENMITGKEANDVIMQAPAHWFADEN